MSGANASGSRSGGSAPPPRNIAVIDEDWADEDPEGAAHVPSEGVTSSGGTWLTYRYRLQGEGTTPATGTIKAPSFLAAARRLLARRLGDAVGPTPAYLRLRAAGELEVLFRVSRTGMRGADALRVEVVPAGSHAVARTADAPASADDKPPAAEPARPGSPPTPLD
jgi:hypothetical protein